MKMPWRTLLEVAASVAETTVPGGKVLIGGVKKLLDPDDTNNLEAVQEVESGLFTALEAIKEKNVADEALFAEGSRELYLGFAKVRASLKVPPAVAPAEPV